MPLGILWAQQVIVVLIVYDFKITHISCYFCLSYFWQSSLIEFIGPKKNIYMYWSFSTNNKGGP